jgi:UDP-N-acetylglucosamine--N-acetylmuramyl-(pentapeptide) pyrophosphoryl-undecaprenol N-acetylglucosamine transferase
MRNAKASPAYGLSVVIAGGGTGGHLYPGVAVARELLRRDAATSISFAGTARGLETTIVPREGFPLDLIRSAGLKGKSPMTLLRGLTLVPLGVLDSWRLLSRRRPDVVIGVGGYSSGPVVLSAALRGIPTLVLEQNAVPGLTNRLLARFVRAAAVTFDETRAFFGQKAIVTGNPVRAEFLDVPPSATSVVPRLLVVGGSQGARAINTAVVAAASQLQRRLPGLEIVHQTGPRDLDAVRAGYAAAGVPARVEAFLDPVVTEMRAASLIVCRAGATTLAELAALGRPAVLVPFPAATDDHQRKNAEVLAAAGAAVLIEERALSADAVADAVAGLVGAPAELVRMGRAMQAFSRPDAAARIADCVLGLAGVTPREARS